MHDTNGRRFKAAVHTEDVDKRAIGPAVSQSGHQLVVGELVVEEHWHVICTQLNTHWWRGTRRTANRPRYGAFTRRRRSRYYACVRLTLSVSIPATSCAPHRCGLLLHVSTFCGLCVSLSVCRCVCYKRSKTKNGLANKKTILASVLCRQKDNRMSADSVFCRVFFRLASTNTDILPNYEV